MKKETSGLKASTVILLILLLISAVFVILVETGAFKINKSSNKVVKYSSINECLRHVDFEVKLPNFMNNIEDLDYRVSNNTFIEIGSSKIVLKAAKLVNYSADPLALYLESKTDIKYTVNNSDIKFFRIRLGYKNMENCTIVNWVQDETAYGIIFSSIYKEDELLNMFGIDKENLIINNKEEEATDEGINVEYINTTIAGKFNLDIPKFKTSFKTVELKGYTICYIDNTKVFVFIYDDYNIDSGTFSGQEEIIIDDKLVLRYISENPFDEGTDAYIDYKTFIYTINNIINSIKYQ